jgi:hypothetical protein
MPHEASSAAFARLSSTPNRIAQRPPYGPHELIGSTLPPASHHRAADERATASRAASPPDRATRPRLSQPFGWPRVAGHHALGVVASGRIGPDTVHGIKNSFSIYLILEILANFQNS